MNAHRDPDRLIAAFLADGLDELPDRTYERVRSQIERTRQRVVIGPWREPQMTMLARIGIAAAAVLVAAVVGVNLLGRPGDVGHPGTSPSPTPVPSPQAIPAGGAREPGRYIGQFPGLPDGPLHRHSFTLPAGWETEDGGIIQKGTADPPAGVGILLFDAGDVRVYRDSCNWKEGGFIDVGPGVDGVADALASIEGRLVTPPTDVTLDGYAGKVVELTTPESLSLGACSDGMYRTLVIAEDDARYNQGPNQHDRIYILEVEGEILAIDAAFYPATPAETMTELEAIVHSIHFEP